MATLVDTNTLLRTAQPSHPLCKPTAQAVASLLRRQDTVITDYKVMGLKVYDARLVAIMNVYGVKSILTYNSADFALHQLGHPSSVAGIGVLPDRWK